MLAKFPLSTLFLSISLMFSAACSETSSSTADPDKENDEQNQAEEVDRISLTGLAIKGLVRGAKIEVFALEDNGVFSTTTIGSGASDNLGEYQLLLNQEVADYTGPVKVVLSHLPQASIQCDDPSGCGNGILAGDFYPMPEDFSLVAIAELSSGVLSSSGDSVINLTALTTLASRFIENDTISEDSIERGNNQVRAVLALPSTVDLTTTRATNIVDDESTGDKFYGAINAAFQRIANNSGQSLTEVIAGYAEDFADGQIIYKSTGDEPTFKTLIDATIDLGELDGADLTKAQGIQATVDAQANDVETNIMPPAIELGNNRQVETNSNVTITAATVSGLPTSYSWQVIAGPEVFAAINDSPNNSISFTSPNIGSEISIRVIAKDASGLTDNDIITVQVLEPLNVDISASGGYHGMLSQRGLAAGTGSNTWREIFADTDFTGGQNWNLVVNNDGTGSMNITSGESLRHGIWAGLETPNQLNNLFSEARNDIEPGGSFPFVQTASGNIIVKVPAQEHFDDQEPKAHVSNAKDFEILKFAKDSYIGRNHEKELEYSVANGQIEFNNLLSQKNFITSLLFSKKHPMDNFDLLNGKQYVGMEQSFNLQPNSLGVSVTRFDLSFNDALGNITIGNEDGFQLSGLFNAANTEANIDGVMSISPISHPDETFNIGPINQGLISFSDPQGIFQLAVNPDQSAILGVYNDWANSDGSSEFTTPAIEYREAGLSAYFQRPATPILLDGKSFQVQSMTHYYQLAQPASAGQEIAGRFLFKRGLGSISFANGNATFSITEETFLYRYPNDDIGQPAELVSISQPQTLTRTLISPSETGEDGCFLFSELPSSLFCTNGQSMLMRENNDVAGSSQLDKFLSFYIGSALQ